MADNVNATPGFVPCGVNGQGEYKGSVNRYVHPAADGTAVHKFSVVKRDGGADASTGLPTAIAAGDTDTPCGIVIGMVPDPSDLNTHYCKASTRRILLVADDPGLYFKAIGDDVGETLDAAHVGENVTQETAGITPSTLTGNSLVRLDSSTSATTNTLTIRLVKLDETVDRSVVDGDKYKVWVCKFNLHQDSSTTGV